MRMTARASLLCTIVGLAMGCASQEQRAREVKVIPENELHALLELDEQLGDCLKRCKERNPEDAAGLASITKGSAIVSKLVEDIWSRAANAQTEQALLGLASKHLFGHTGHARTLPTRSNTLLTQEDLVRGLLLSKLFAFGERATLEFIQTSGLAVQLYDKERVKGNVEFKSRLEELRDAVGFDRTVISDPVSKTLVAISTENSVEILARIVELRHFAQAFRAQGAAEQQDRTTCYSLPWDLRPFRPYGCLFSGAEPVLNLYLDGALDGGASIGLAFADEPVIRFFRVPTTVQKILVEAGVEMRTSEEIKAWLTAGNIGVGDGPRSTSDADREGWE